ncbi:DNA adenine methylase [Tumidithrix elongata RA019]|uniref:Site-specific DNA-methyltransferase (adenine-specific) n=1 Tax=Tumidithrix elongata BACA0141 TaxID=2716417 RepID=A0AAW9Q3I1_9CYAN|nr:DNA adenine methylase [Tumidithrix elongata RA019]
MSVNPLVRPFLKWAGGKRQLVPVIIPEIQKHLPKGSNRYYEPFIGAGAILLTLQPKKAVINDTNAELINCYQVIRDAVEDLIDLLEDHKARNSEDYYYEIREKDRETEYIHTISKEERAARIIYLNKTCYNGLFRVNSQGQFNVPFGRYKNPSILDEAVLRGVSNYLNQNQVEILNLDFQDAVSTAKKGDFIYFDPPYDPVSDTASFTGYDVNGFNKKEQERLRDVANNLIDRKCKILLSNACTDFILDLYNDTKRYKIEKVPANRAINSNALKRGKIEEVLIRNYE